MASPVLGYQIRNSSVGFGVRSSSACSSSLFITSHQQKKSRLGPRSPLLGISIRAEAMATEKLGIKVERNPPESKLAALGIRNWPKWGCPPSKFPWEYTAKETCYLLQGKVKVFPDDGNVGVPPEFVEIGAGDLVEFPKGMKCTWDVQLAVDKHYNFE